jgi:hypothetical protein
MSFTPYMDTDMPNCDDENYTLSAVGIARLLIQAYRATHVNDEQLEKLMNLLNDAAPELHSNGKPNSAKWIVAITDEIDANLLSYEPEL